MKTIGPNTKIENIEIGDRFLNTTFTVNGQWWRERDVGGKLRTYVPVICDCGNEVRGRWDRLHTTDPNKAPWSSRCSKCAAGGKRRTMDGIWHNRAKSADELPQNFINDLSGQQVGDLYIIRRVGTDNQSHSLYECRCSCGNIEVFRDSTLKGSSPRLACRKCMNNISKGEKWIQQTLEKLKIDYKMQYIFSDLMGDKTNLRFDFALLNKEKKPYALIEFQGKQHYEPVEFFGGQERFEQQKRYDQRKRDYCKEKGIKLLEIPYTKYENYLIF